MRLLRKYNILLSGSSGWLVLLIVLLLILKIIHYQRMSKKNETVQKLLTELLRFYGFKDAMIKIIIAQFAHETNNFNSKSFREGYNPCGMKVPLKRITRATGTLYSHAKYESLTDAIHDFRLYWDYYKYPQSYPEPLAIEQYIADLKNNSYFTDSEENYLKGVKHFYSLYND